MYKSLLALSLILPTTVSAEQLWLTVDKDTLPAIAELQGFSLVPNIQVAASSSPAAVVRVDSSQQDILTAVMHDTYHRCPGYMVHQSQEEAEQAIIASQLSTSFTAPEIIARGNIPNWLGQVQESRITDMIRKLSDFTNRFYTTSHGVNASNYIHDEWQAIASTRSDMTVEKYDHRDWPQDSVILTFKGHTKPDEIVVIGGHLDSTVGRSTGENTRAPGADDNASGIATFTEVIRVLASQPDFKPDRTLQFMGYAAEEVGLLGSAEIAADYKRSNKDVKGVLQLDMTNYHGSMDDFYFVSDYTNATQTQYLKDLVKEYLPEYRVNDTACGYACSDHASWHRNGFPASMPSESKFGEHNKAIHTAGDTLDKSGHAAAHAYKFAKLALTYAADMTNLESDPEPYIEFTVNGLEVSFNYNTSGSNRFTSQSWSFGDGNASSSASPTHTYAQAGSYNVSVRLTDSSGHTETATSLVNVQGNSCLFGEVVPSWSESETYSPGDKVSYRSSIYEATWWSVGARPDIYSNVWKNLGSDNGGGDDCKDNTAPVAKFSVTTNKLTATFTDQSTDDKGVVSRQWDFGDGTVSSVASPTHQYSEDGDYTVTLSVTDKEGLNSEISKTISVKDDTDNGSCSVEAWSSSKVYNSGDEVSHKGNRYRAKWWTQGEDPSSTGQWGVWENLGACQIAK